MYEVLFEPLAFGPKAARNRIMRAATSTNLAAGNAVGERLVAHYRALAAGGVGTIVSEALRIHPSTVKPLVDIAAFQDASVPGLASWAAAVHEQDALLIGQLGHSGRQHTSSSVPGRLVGPSPVACPRSGGVPHPLSVGEIEELIDGFAASARNLARAGFDGVEINCAQGHLLQQFLSPFSNLREDGYGGSFDNRARFAVTVLRRLRGMLPKGVIVGLRLGIEEFTDGGLTTELSTKFARLVADEQLIDYLSLSQGNFNSIDAHLPDRHHPPTPYAGLQARVGRQIGRVPVVACTRIVTPEDAVRILEQGWADAVALGRALTADPQWPNKAGSGRAARIRRCIQCNHCWAGRHEGAGSINCVVNPEVGDELAPPPAPATTVREVLVIGGGPAGLATARVAAERGHRVTVFERDAELGGKVRSGARLGGHDEYRYGVSWLIQEVNRLGVAVRLGRAATVADATAQRPDAVVIATGATPVVPRLRSDGSVRCVATVEELPTDLSGQTVVLFDEDGHYWPAQAAEELARRGARVELVTRFFEPFRELPIVSRIAALRLLDQHGVRITPTHEIDRVESYTVHLRHYDSRRPRTIDGVSAAVWIGPQVPNDALAQAVRAALPDVPVHVIGDAYAPRRLRHAIQEGNRLGGSI